MTSTQQCYRQLAQAIIDPVLPLDEPAAINARRGPLRLVAPIQAVVLLGSRRAA